MTAAYDTGWTPDRTAPFAAGTPTSELNDTVNDAAMWDAIDAMFNLPDNADFTAVYLDSLAAAGVHLAHTSAQLADDLCALHHELAATATDEQLDAIQTAATIAAPHQPTLTINRPNQAPIGPNEVTYWIFTNWMDIYDRDPANDPDDTLSFIDHAAVCDHKPVKTLPELAATLRTIRHPRRQALLDAAIELTGCANTDTGHTPQASPAS